MSVHLVFCVMRIPRTEPNKRRISEFGHGRLLLKNSKLATEPFCKNEKFVTDRSPPFYTRTASGTQKHAEIVMKCHMFVTLSV